MPSWVWDALMNPFVELVLIGAIVYGVLAIRKRRAHGYTRLRGQRSRLLWWQSLEGKPFSASHDLPYSQQDALLLASMAPSPPLRLRQWLDRVNHQPDRHPHLIAMGRPGSGKTTMALAVLGDRPGRLVVTTPKSHKADPWGGLPVIRLRPYDMSFASIQQAIEAVYQEMLRRNAEYPDVEHEWLTLVIDEYPTVRAGCEGIEEQILAMLRFADRVRIRLMLLSSENDINALGLKVDEVARQNCIFVELDEDRHGVIYHWGKAREPIETTGILLLAHRRIPAVRWWYPTKLPDQPAISTQVPPDRTEAVSNLLEKALGSSELPLPPENLKSCEEKDPVSQSCSSASEDDLAASTPDFSAEEIAQIGALIASGKRKPEVVKAMPRYSERKHSLYSAYYDRMLVAVHRVLDV